MENQLGSWIDPVALRQLRRAYGQKDSSGERSQGQSPLAPEPSRPSPAPVERAQPSQADLDSLDALLGRYETEARDPSS